MTSEEFSARVRERAANSGVSVGGRELAAFETYFRLLEKWNARINLTAFDLSRPSHAAIDRLLIEPMAAAAHIEGSWTPWVDVGSGGGSPAVPIKILQPSLSVTLVESRGKKAAFLREVVRTLGLTGVSVETGRFEDMAQRPSVAGAARLVTVRGVRLDDDLTRAASVALGPAGRLMWFRETPIQQPLSGFDEARTIGLRVSADEQSFLHEYMRQDG